MHSRRSLLRGSLLLALAPAVFSLSGCGLGGGGGIAQPVQGNVAALMALSQNQNARLNLTISNANITGTLVVNPPVQVQGPSVQDFNFVVPPDTYEVTGTLSFANQFSLTGTFPDPIGLFHISGNVPVFPDNSGAYTIIANTQTSTGTFTEVPGTAD